MSLTGRFRAVTGSTVKKGWIDSTIVVLATVIFINIVLAVLFDREHGFKLIPMWVTMLSLCMVQREMLASAVLLGLVLCGLSEWVCWFPETSAVKWQKIPPTIVADAMVLIFVDLLAAVKLENIASKREMEYGSLRKNQNEHVELVEKIKKKQLESKEAASPETKQDRATAVRKNTLEMQKSVYIDVMNLRYRREVPKMLETLFGAWCGYKFGVVFEIGEDSKDLKLRAHWGVADTRADALSLISSFKENAIVRYACDRRDPVMPEDLKKDMVLFDGLQAFNTGLFALALVVPVVVQDRPAFIVMLGEPLPDARLPYDIKVVSPVLTAVSMSLVKIGSKDARPSFSTFAPGT